ncbi:hypothetical protein [Streptomyces sp. NPDC046862]|uniref:hypothetical protein n=1 Tax=Streptomyces sp. NPDC046862 TaxID=3154603 RepID=UPI0034545648
MGTTAGESTTALLESGESEPPQKSASPRPDRTGLIIAGAVLAACGGLVLYGVLNGEDEGGAQEHRVPTAEVTYEVTGTGTADITYQARGATGKTVTVDAADLPWRKTVEVPLGTEPLVGITLGEKGGQLRCALAIRGQHVQSATAAGKFGRATCSGELAAQEAR